MMSPKIKTYPIRMGIILLGLLAPRFVFASDLPHRERVHPAASPMNKAVGSALLQVKDAWIRVPTPGAASVALYLTVRNPDKKSWRLQGVRIAVAMSAELHETVVDQRGIATMRHVPFLEVGPGETKELRPGGLHIMVMGLKRQLKEGEILRCELLAHEGPSLTFEAIIKP